PGLAPTKYAIVGSGGLEAGNIRADAEDAPNLPTRALIAWGFGNDEGTLGGVLAIRSLYVGGVAPGVPFLDLFQHKIGPGVGRVRSEGVTGGGAAPAACARVSGPNSAGPPPGAPLPRATPPIVYAGPAGTNSALVAADQAAGGGVPGPPGPKGDPGPP